MKTQKDTWLYFSALLLLLLVGLSACTADLVTPDGTTSHVNTDNAEKEGPGNSDLSTRPPKAIHSPRAPNDIRLRVQTLTDLPNSSGWIGQIYIETDGKQGAEKTIKILNTRNWQLLESSGRPGLYDKQLAWGLIDPNGDFRGLPNDTFDGSKKVWTAGAIKATRAGVPVPSRD